MRWRVLLVRPPSVPWLSGAALRILRPIAELRVCLVVRLSALVDDGVPECVPAASQGYRC